ncbi:cobalamin-binding protein [Thalassotalea mangrovi]|uniref:Cobalamin-binding protein n=1 Tax=Thalassotalea mangrovi TaxID=2572245 RepID=A0A4U1B4J2_9GAMM|nr:cobalamin-binding protein [Thalassotalea mangrovi]TKB45129.1 cobalamin-binding protein [Thalassotalea mangrovi]
MSRFTTGLYALALALALCLSSPAIGAQKQPEPLRIIALAPHLVEMLYDIGLGDNIVATLEHADYPGAATSIPVVGSYAQLNIEAIIALQADIIIAWKSGNPDADIQRLRQLGQTVVYSNPQTIDDIARETEAFAVRFGKAGIGQGKAQEFRASIKKLRHKYQHKAPVRVFYQIWSQPLTTVAGKAWSQQQLELCAAVNPFSRHSRDYPQVNIEDVLLADPQLLIIPTGTDNGESTAINWQRYPQLSAIKHNQIVQPNADILHRMTLRLPAELGRLCQQIEQSRQYYQQIDNGMSH